VGGRGVPTGGRAPAYAVVAELHRLGATVVTGRFGAHMLVELANDGPVPVVVDA